MANFDKLEREAEHEIPKKVNKEFKRHYLLYILGSVIITLIVGSLAVVSAKNSKEAKHKQDLLQQQVDLQRQQLELQRQQLEQAKATPTPTAIPTTRPASAPTTSPTARPTKVCDAGDKYNALDQAKRDYKQDLREEASRYDDAIDIATSQPAAFRSDAYSQARRDHDNVLLSLETKYEAKVKEINARCY